MYTKIKNVQIIISLMKQHGIRHIVLSAGTRHVPIAHSVENDDFFKCYSVVDERSAGYFALGLAKELGEPVAIACTSSTATCNYVPPIAEAYYQKVPLLILTGDRDPYRLDQLEDQMIDQVDMYRNFCKKCVNLPLVNSERDIWYCQRLVNEAILELRHHGAGPVQINFPINQSIEDIADASEPALPVYNLIRRYSREASSADWACAAQELKDYKRIIVVCGSGAPASAELQAAMSDFAARYCCVIATEPLSNVHCEGSVNTYLFAEAASVQVLKQLAPDLIIFMGGNFISRLKVLLRDLPDCRSWVINDTGRIMDLFQNLSALFECDESYFFRWFADHAQECANDGVFYRKIRTLCESVQSPTMEQLLKQVNRYTVDDARFKKLPSPEEKDLIPEDYLSSMLAISELSARMPHHSLVHLSILNSTRMFPLFHTDETTAVYSNIGTDGIDGSMSTFLGQAFATDRPCYLVIGDLSFFYDMNAIGMRSIRSNVHILLINNGGGAEFYFSMGPKLLPNIDLHISAAHHQSAKEWVEANHFRYLKANNRQEFMDQIDRFMDPAGDGPVVFELFTDKERDVKMLKGFRRMIHLDTSAHKLVKQINDIPVVKKAMETPAGQSVKSKLKQGLKRFI